MAESHKIAGLKRSDHLAALKVTDAQIFGPETRLVFFCETTVIARNWMEMIKPARALAERLGRSNKLPVLATNSASSSLANALRECGWAILEVPMHRRSRVQQHLDMPRGAFLGRDLNVLVAVWQLQAEVFSSSQLARLARVSVPFARRILRDSVQRGWIGVRTSRRQNFYQVEKPLALMEAILFSTGSFPENWRRFSVRPGELSAVPGLLDSFCQERGLTYSVTGTYAANYYLNRWSGVPELQLRISSLSDVSTLLLHLRATPVETGGNVAMLVSLTDVHWLFRTRVDGVELANPLIVASDLARMESSLSAAMQNYLLGSGWHSAPEI